MKGSRSDGVRYVVTPVPGVQKPNPGAFLPVQLDQIVVDHVGDSEPGPHPVGKAEVLKDGRLSLWPVDTKAGRTGRAMIEDELLDAFLSGSPPTVRLGVI